jgi:hypothetical protein
MATRCVSWDTETHRIRPGVLAPRLVCSAIAMRTPDGYVGELLDKDGTDVAFAQIADDPTMVVALANAPFDLLVQATRMLETRGLDIMPEIFKMLMDDQRVFDIQTAQMLDAVAEGCLGKDPRTGGPLVSPETGRRAGYSLSVVTDLVLGRKDAKVNDEWREKYHELDGVPIAEWPANARDYPIDDGRNTAEDALAQAGHAPRAGVHRWGPQTNCEWCGMTPKAAYDGEGKYKPCTAPRRARNLHDLSNQVATAWALHLGAAHGFSIDQTMVDAIERDALDGRTEAEEPFIKAGIFRREASGEVSRDMSAIARAVAIAYGADVMQPCSACKGTRKVVSSKAKPVKCPACKGVARPAIASTTGLAAFTTAPPPPCLTCSGAGAIPNPRQLVNCTTCGATGLDLDAAPHLPKTETGRVGTGRDVLNESGDEMLMALADHMEDAKTLDVYVPWLRSAREPVAGHGPLCSVPTDDKAACSCPGPYRDIAKTLWPNVLLETGRISYMGVVQLLPRAPGYWRTYRETVEVAYDYVLQDGESWA